MTLGEALRALGGAGVELRADGSALLHRPADVPPGLAAALRLHRPTLLALLGWGDDPLAGWGEDARYIFSERLAIADGLGLDARPGSPAWATALGEALAVEPPE